MKCWTRGRKDGSKYVTCDTKAKAKSKPKAKAKSKPKAKAKPQQSSKAKPKAKPKSYADRVDDVVGAAQKVADRQAKGPKMFKMRNRIRGDR
jgi:hypothetical protein